MALYFPVTKWTGTSYKEGMTQFGWRRDGGARTHAGCDLYAPLESDVVAVTDGVIIESAYFYLGTYQISIDHGTIGLIRYGEAVKIPKELTVGAKIKAGDLVGKVGHAAAKLSPMLHLELFDGSGTGSLSIPKGAKEPTHYNDGVLPNGKYRRRADLMNPTSLLDRLASEGKK